MTGRPDLPISRTELLAAWARGDGPEGKSLEAVSLAKRRGWGFRQLRGDEHLQIMRETGHNFCTEVTDDRGNVRRFRTLWAALFSLSYDRLVDASEDGPPLPSR